MRYNEPTAARISSISANSRSTLSLGLNWFWVVSLQLLRTKHAMDRHSSRMRTGQTLHWHELAHCALAPADKAKHLTLGSVVAKVKSLNWIPAQCRVQSTVTWHHASVTTPLRSGAERPWACCNILGQAILFPILAPIRYNHQ